jgi:toxin FitB
MLIDSNIIIYAAQPAHVALREFIAIHAPAVSDVSYVEVLGYHRLTPEEKSVFARFFASAPRFPLNRPILDKAIELRQQRKCSLGDSLIAATALIHQKTLVTHNISDFAWISDLVLIDPLHAD